MAQNVTATRQLDGESSEGTVWTSSEQLALTFLLVRRMKMCMCAEAVRGGREGGGEGEGYGTCLSCGSVVPGGRRGRQRSRYVETLSNESN